jgi:hypothetical protein
MSLITRCLGAMALAVAAIGSLPAAAQVVVTTPAIDQAAVTDRDGRPGMNILVDPPEIVQVGWLRQGAETTVGFDVPRYNAGGVLTGVEFQGRIASTSVSYGGAPLQSGTVALGSVVSLGGQSVQGLGLTGRVLGVGGTTIGAYDTATGTVAASALSGFYGAGTASGTWMELLTVDRIGLIPNLQFRADPASHTAEISVNYTAVGHANGSFTANPADDNATLAAFNGAGSQSFQIHNGAGLFALDVGSVSCSGDCSYFTVMGTWSALAGGSFAPGAVVYDGLAPGAASATFSFLINDSADTGIAGVGRLSELETLRLTVTAVPEPSALALALSGGLLLAWAARRHRPALQPPAAA